MIFHHGKESMMDLILTVQNDWKFVTSTAGSSNGKLIETHESEEVTITLDFRKIFLLVW